MQRGDKRREEERWERRREGRRRVPKVVRRG